MRRRSKWFALLLLAGGVSACVGAVLYLAKREPNFYAAAPQPATFETRDKAARLLTRVQDLKNDIRSKADWGDTFSADDLNCFFVENMGPKGALAAMLPKGFHSPRVSVEGDHLRLGLKYGDGFWSTVVWVELKVWLVENEVNLAAVEVCDLRTGCLPVGSQSILDSISEAARDSNVDVTWYRKGSNPVGLFRFFASQAEPTSQIRTLAIADGKIVVAGQSLRGHSPSLPVALSPLTRGPGE